MSRKGRGGGGADDVAKDNVLQAVLLADSFTKKTFRPITLEQPKVLLPLVNVPMLQYTIEFLASSGVGELFIFCAGHAQQIEEYIERASEWRDRWLKGMRIHCICRSNCLSAGDALREIDSMGVVRSDPFVLITGDVIANIDLAPIIEAHKARKKKRSSCVMTSLFREASTRHRTRPLFDDLVVVLDKETGQILEYSAGNAQPDQNTRSASTRGRDCILPTEFLFEEGHTNVTFRYDLLDTHIDICSPEVLLTFSDNFDYQDLRSDFMRNEVQNIELGVHITAHVVQGQYAARVHDPRTYDAVSKDVLHRWVMPMVPDNNFLFCDPPTTYRFQRGFTYKEQGISLTRPCHIGRSSAIGAGTTVGAHAHVVDSVIGRGCKLGEHVHVVGSTVWENCVVEDGATVEQAIVCTGVVIKKGAVVNRGCVLSFGVVIGEGHVVPPFTRLTKAIVEDEFADDDKDEGERPWDVAACGAGGEGWLWADESDSDGQSDDDDDDDGSGYQNAAAGVGTGGGGGGAGSSDGGGGDADTMRSGGTAPPLPPYHVHAIGSSEAELARLQQWGVWAPPSSSDEEDGALFDDEEGPPEAERFTQAVYYIMQTAVRDRELPDNIFLEIKGMKFAQNKTFAECVEALLPPLLDIAAQEQKPGEVISKLSGLLKHWASVIQRCLIDLETQTALVHALEVYCLDAQHETQWTSLFRFALQMFYDMEFVTDSVLLSWATSRRELPEDDAKRKLFDLPSVKEFIVWLEEEESDSGSDSGSDSSSDSGSGSGSGSSSASD